MLLENGLTCTHSCGVFGLGVGVAVGVGVGVVGVGVGVGVGVAEARSVGDGDVLADGVALADGVELADGVAVADGVALADGAALGVGLTVAAGDAEGDAAPAITAASRVAVCVPAPTLVALVLALATGGVAQVLVAAASAIRSVWAVTMPEDPPATMNIPAMTPQVATLARRKITGRLLSRFPRTRRPRPFPSPLLTARMSHVGRFPSATIRHLPPWPGPYP